MPHTKQSDILDQVVKLLVPEEYLQDFYVNHISENKEEWVLELVEKEDRIPKPLAGKEVAFDGYCNSIDILTHAFSLKKYDLHKNLVDILPAQAALLPDPKYRFVWHAA